MRIVDTLGGDHDPKADYVRRSFGTDVDFTYVRINSDGDFDSQANIAEI